MIMVDELRRYPGAKPPFNRGSCHLTTDGDIDALHAFAGKIGLQRAWFQPHPLAPHYDLTPSMRERAMQSGATFVPARQQAIARRSSR